MHEPAVTLRRLLAWLLLLGLAGVATELMLVGHATEVNRLKQYVFIPLDLNTATDDAFKTIPNLPAAMLREFKEYRPWKTKAQFEKEIGKYVGPQETARLWRFMVIK
jgi:hypothetical protein